VALAQPDTPYESDELTLGLWHFDYSEPDSLWATTFGGEENESVYKAIRSHDGAYLLGGYTASFGGGNFDFLLIKMAANGELVWTQFYGNHMRESCHDLVQLENGNIALAGTHMPGGRDPAYMLLLADENGDSLWSRLYHGEGREKCTSIIATEDSGFLLGGSNNVQIMDSEIWIIKTDEEGDVEWEETYGTEYRDGLIDMEIIPNEGYLLGGWWTWRNETEIAYIAKIDFEGEVIWERFDGGDEGWGSFCRSIRVTEDGYLGTGNAGGSAWLVSLTEDGEIDWSFGHGLSNGYWHRSLNTIDGGHIIGGTRRLPNAQRFGLIKISEDRETLWMRNYGGRLDFGYDLILNDDNSYTIFGTTETFGAGGIDVFVLRTHPDVSPNLDISDFLHHGEPVGGVESAEGIWDDAIALPIDHAGYMLVQDAETLRPDEFTIEGWFKMQDEFDHPGTILSKLLDEERVSYDLYANSADNEIGLILNTEDNEYRLTFETDPDDNEWHHIAGSCGDGALRLFYDGELVGEEDVAEPVLHGEGPLLIGNAEENAGGDHQFYGLIEEVRISNIPIWSITPLLISSIDSLNFGTISVDSSVSSVFEVVNKGNSLAEVWIEDSAEDGIFIWEEVDEFGLARGDTMTLEVLFYPREQGDFSDTITISYIEEELEIYLTGSGYVNAARDDVYYPIVKELLRANPNPFNSVVQLNYTISRMSPVQLIIYDSFGHEVALLVDSYHFAGIYDIVWNASGLPSGIYLSQLSTQNVTITTKLILIK